MLTGIISKSTAERCADKMDLKLLYSSVQSGLSKHWEFETTVKLMKLHHNFRAPPEHLHAIQGKTSRGRAGSYSCLQKIKVEHSIKQEQMVLCGPLPPTDHLFHTSWSRVSSTVQSFPCSCAQWAVLCTHGLLIEHSSSREESSKIKDAMYRLIYCKNR